MRVWAATMAVMASGDETTAERLAQALEMFEFGVEMMAANLRRRHPEATPEQIDQLVDQWLAERPGAEHGDSDGVPISLDRFR
jgi:hypothetical protein